MPNESDIRRYRRAVWIDIAKLIVSAIMLLTLILALSYELKQQEINRAAWAAQLKEIESINKDMIEIRYMIVEMQLKQREDAMIVSRGAERTATVTAYTWTGQKTASGTWPKEGRTVAGPRNIPFGTVVWIDGIGERIVEDRTHERFDGRYDVYMDSEEECIQWGIQERVIR